MDNQPKKRSRMQWEFWLYALPATCLLVVWGCGEDGPGGSSEKEYDPRSRVTSRNNLKHIGIALHMYHDTHRTFPPGGIYTRDGKPYHSTLTMLLPYVDMENLYERINPKKPWTDPSNAFPFQQKVPPYLIPEFSSEETDSNGRALSHYALNSHVFRKNGLMRIRNITDGVSNTLLAGEVSTGFKPWGDPDNVRDPSNGLGKEADKFYGPHGGRTIFLMGDGSLREMNNNIAPEILKHLATPAGGEKPDSF